MASTAAAAALLALGRSQADLSVLIRRRFPERRLEPISVPKPDGIKPDGPLSDREFSWHNKLLGGYMRRGSPLPPLMLFCQMASAGTVYYSLTNTIQLPTVDIKSFSTTDSTLIV